MPIETGRVQSEWRCVSQPHHPRKDGPLTRDVDQQDGPENPGVRLIQLPRQHARLPYGDALAGDADRVQREEGRVLQPGEPWPLDAGRQQGEVGVADDLGDAPGQQHDRVEAAVGGEREEVDGAPDDGQAAGDLQEGLEEARADDACEPRTVRGSG